MGRIVDLTLELYDGIEVFIHPKLCIVPFHQHWFTKGLYQPPAEGFQTRMIMMVDHMGTHVDAPLHFFQEGDALEKVPVESLMGSAYFFDVSTRGKDTAVRAQDLIAAEKRNDIQMQPDDIALIRAWDGGWGEKGFYECRGMTRDAVEWLLTRRPKAVGIDLATLDDLMPCDPTRPAHYEFLKRKLPIIEDLVNLEQLRTPRFQFTGLPLKIRGLTGSPIRAIAIEED
jgi:kynurenine formamidase